MRAAVACDRLRQLRTACPQNGALARLGADFRARGIFHGRDQQGQPPPFAVSAMPLFEPLTHRLSQFQPGHPGRRKEIRHFVNYFTKPLVPLA
jgi:hypothetical protein